MHLVHSGGAAKVSATFLADTLSQVAGAAASVHRFALGRKPKSLFGALVGLDLGLSLGLGHRSFCRKNPCGMVNLNREE